MSAHEIHNDSDHIKNHENLSLSWLRSLQACETGCFTEYNLDSVRPDLTVPETALERPGMFSSNIPMFLQNTVYHHFLPCWKQNSESFANREHLIAKNKQKRIKSIITEAAVITKFMQIYGIDFMISSN